jgi:predicted DNA-binding transcriptional regulator YafY
VLEASARLLRLLALLQSRHEWSGSELAVRLEVTTRTVRKDMDRLRRLGYPVQATPGVAGGYRLGAGAALPPLLLDDEEAVAVTIGLRSAAAGSVRGIEEASLRAVQKLEHVLPGRLRQRVTALQTSMVPVSSLGPMVDPEVLTALAAACYDHERLRFDYRDHRGIASLRRVEPYRLVSWGYRWYLVAWDLERQEWRTFRADRIRPQAPTGMRFTPRPLPDGDVATYVARTVGAATWAFRARVKVHASADVLVARLPFAIGLVEPIDPDTCWFDCGSDTPHQLAVYLGMLDLDFEVVEPTEFVQALARLAERYQRAIRSPLDREDGRGDALGQDQPTCSSAATRSFRVPR